MTWTNRTTWQNDRPSFPRDSAVPGNSHHPTWIPLSDTALAFQPLTSTRPGPLTRADFHIARDKPVINSLWPRTHSNLYPSRTAASPNLGIVQIRVPGLRHHLSRPVFLSLSCCRLHESIAAASLKVSSFAVSVAQVFFQ